MKFAADQEQDFTEGYVSFHSIAVALAIGSSGFQEKFTKWES